MDCLVVLVWVGVGCLLLLLFTGLVACFAVYCVRLRFACALFSCFVFVFVFAIRFALRC